jgi:uncharacterized protein YbjT (DUF2867 family)
MILVTGATGHVGSELVAQLVERGERVRAMTRRPEAGGFPPGVEVVRGDFEDCASIDAALDGVARVFLMTAQEVGSAGAPTHVRLFADAARQAGIRRIVMLSVLGGGGSDPGDPFARWFHQAEGAVKNSGAAWTFLRPGRFMSNALQWAPMIKRDGRVTAPFGRRPAASVDPADIAAVALRALTGPGHENRAYELSGPEALTPVQEVDILAGALGRSLGFTHVSNDAARAGMLRAGMAEHVVDAIIARAEKDDSGAEVLPAVREVTGRPPRRFAEWARAHLGAFR